MTLIPMVLCGGKGSRLWPLSRQRCPKPFIPLPKGQNLFQQAINRAGLISEASPILLVSSQAFLPEIKDNLKALNPEIKKRGYCLLEPKSKNTASAIALAANWAVSNWGPDIQFLVLTADHLIYPEQELTELVNLCLPELENHPVILFGIKPQEPSQEYGYFRLSPAKGKKLANIVEFIEKPNIEQAKELLASGECYWNSGMALFQVPSLLRAFDQYAQEISQTLSVLNYSHDNLFETDGLKCWSAPEAAYDNLPNISIDYALWEKLPDIQAAQASFHWHDIGSFLALGELMTKDAQNNRVISDKTCLDSTHSSLFYQKNPHKLTLGFGLDDLVVVDTEDVLLVCHKDKLPQIKEYYEFVMSSYLANHS